MKEQTSQSQKDAILQILLLSKFTKRHTLRHALMTAGYILSDRRIRKEIERMIIDDHYGIASSEKGYSLITCEADLNEAKDYLFKKTTALLVRKNCLTRNFNEGKLQAQLSLFNGEKIVI